MQAPRVVVMGVSGCGKSTLGRALAASLHVPYVEGDDLHPPANVQRMAAGIALTDTDRHGWLQEVGRRLSDAVDRGQGVVVACSALKRSYRDQLRRSAPDVRFVHLHGELHLLEQRLARRQGHYMPLSLLQSQLQTLEPPGEDEHAISLDLALSPEALVSAAAKALAAL